MQIVNSIEYITADEALACRLVNKAEYERWIYGGLTKKQHDHMIAMALETSGRVPDSLPRPWRGRRTRNLVISPLIPKKQWLSVRFCLSLPPR